MAAFLADHMLDGLARRLRLLGYDCILLPADLVQPGRIERLAREQGRVLLTVSARAHAAAICEILQVPPTGLAAQVREVVIRYPVDFARLMFSRCCVDNTPLDAVVPEQVSDRLPPLIRERGPRSLHHCPMCDRLYWPGSHTDRVLRQCAEWLPEWRDIFKSLDEK
jgi:uncharacterized protein